MEKITPYDFGGRELFVPEVVSDDLIGTIQGLNRTLGTPDDPYYPSYKSFIEEVRDADLVLIDTSILSRNSYDDLNLSGVSSNVQPFVDKCLMVANTLMTLFKGDVCQSTAQVVNYGKNIDYYVTDEWFMQTDGDMPKTV